MRHPILHVGFSTIELLIAMAVLTLVLSAALALAFSSRLFAADAQAYTEALDRASEAIDAEEALGQEDFTLIAPATTTASSGSTTYTTAIAVTLLPDLLTKQVTATVSWNGSYGRSQSVALTTYVTDYQDAEAGEQCDSALSGDWSAPQIKNTITNFAQLVNDPSGAYMLTDAVVSGDHLYVTQNNSSTSTNTFFIFDISDPESPKLLKAIDNDPKNQTGLTAVAVASSSTGVFAYVASALASEQLQIINVTDPAAPYVMESYKIPASQVPSAGGGTSIFYSNGYVYVGTGKELNIIDVHNPQNPQWIGGYSVGSTINAIVVRDTYAYIASANADNLIVLDITDPADPTLAGNIALPGGSWGEALALAGTTVYLGRTDGGNEFYALDASQPSAIAPLGSADTGTATAANIHGIVVRQNLAFVLTNRQLQMVDMQNPPQFSKFGTPVQLPNASGSSVALACGGDYLYALSNSADAAYLSVIHP